MQSLNYIGGKGDAVVDFLIDCFASSSSYTLGKSADLVRKVIYKSILKTWPLLLTGAGGLAGAYIMRDTPELLRNAFKRKLESYLNRNEASDEKVNLPAESAELETFLKLSDGQAHNLITLLNLANYASPSFAEDSDLKLFEQLLLNMMSNNSEFYHSVKREFADDIETEYIARALSDDFYPMPAPFALKENAELIQILKELPQNINKMSRDEILLSIYDPSVVPDIEHLFDFTINRRRYIRNGYYMPRILTKLIPLNICNIDDPNHVNYLITAMYYVVTYSNANKSMERIIFEAFDSVGCKSEYFRFHKRMETFHNGDNPSFMPTMARLAMLYAYNWYYHLTRKIYGSHFTKEVKMGLYLYLKQNDLLRKALLAISLNFKDDINPDLLDTLIGFGESLEKEIDLDLNNLEAFSQTLKYFKMTFANEILSEHPELLIGSKYTLNCVNIIVSSLKSETKYSLWFKRHKFPRWWINDLNY